MKCYCSGIFSCGYCLDKPRPKVVFFGLSRDGDQLVVHGYGSDPIKPVTGILARYSGDAAGLVAATCDIAEGKF